MRAQARGEVYSDTDATVVWRPRVAATGTTEDLRIGATWMADVVSSASIDVVSRASQAVYDTRHEATATATFRGPEDAEWTASALYGVERDYETWGGSLRAGGSLDADRLYFLSGSLAVSTNRVGSVLDSSFAERLSTVRAGLGLAAVLGTETVMRFNAEFGADLGFQSSAYRNVRLGNWSARRGGGRDPDSTRWNFLNVAGIARENHPRRRHRARVEVDLVQSLTEFAALRARLGGYGDSWEVWALDADLEARIEPTSSWLIRVGARYYEQSGAFFWRARYPDSVVEGSLVSDDKELGPMRSTTLLAAVRASFLEAYAVEARLEGTRYEYPLFTLLPEKWAGIAQVALVWEPSW